MLDRVIKTVAVGLIIAMGFATSAKATIIPGYQVVAGAAVVSDGLVSGALGATGLSFGSLAPVGTATGGPFLPPATGTGLLTTGSLVFSGPTIAGGSFSSFDTGGFVPFLGGAFVDAAFGAGFVDILFAVTGGAAAGAFGSDVVLTLSSPFLSPATLSTLPVAPITIDLTPAMLSIVAVEQVEISAPSAFATIPMGLILFASLKRRRLARYLNL